MVLLLLLTGVNRDRVERSSHRGLILVIVLVDYLLVLVRQMTNVHLIELAHHIGLIWHMLKRINQVGTQLHP